MTPKQKQLLDYIVDYQRRTGGISPSFDEMAVAVGIRSKSGIHRLIGGLEQRGNIRRVAGQARTIRVLAAGHEVTLKDLDSLVYRLARQEGAERTCEALLDLASVLVGPATGPATRRPGGELRA